MKMDLKNSPPILAKWTIKYDELFNMPVYIQGKLVNDYDEYVAGDNVILDDILSVDLKHKAVRTDGGELFFLVGKGMRMLLINDTNPSAGAIWPIGEEPNDQHNKN